MTISAPSIDPHEGSGVDRRTAGADAGQPSEHIAQRRLVRGFYRSVAAGATIPPLVAVASVLPLEAQGAVIVTAWSALMLTYILTTLAKARTDLHTAARQWTEMRDRADEMADDYYALACKHERLKNKYNALYAEHLLQRGVASLMAKRSGRGAAADLPSGVNGSAAVLEFPKGA